MKKLLNHQALSSLIRSLYFLSKEEISHTTKYEPLIRKVVLKSDINLEKWLKFQSERSTYLSKYTASELLTCIGESLDFQDETLLHDKYFSLMADESTNVSNQSELSLVVRYVAPSPSFEVKEKFVCLVGLKSTTAESIFTAIDTELKKRKLSYDRLYLVLSTVLLILVVLSQESALGCQRGRAQAAIHSL